VTRPATEQEARRYLEFMGSRFRVRIVERQDAIEFQLIQALLATLNLPDLTKELDGRSFTIGPFAYLRPGLSPNEKIRTGTHECCHASQFWSDGLDFAYFYAAVGERRVAYEVEGFRAGAEIEYAMTGKMPSLDQLVEPLSHGYALGASDLRLARDLLEGGATSIADGIISTLEAYEGISFMRANFPDVLAI